VIYVDPAQYSDLPPADLAARAQVIGNAETTSFGDIRIVAIAAYPPPVPAAVSPSGT